MKSPLTYAKIHNHLVTKLLKKTFVRDINRDCQKKTGHALIYYKSDPILPGFIQDFSHTNNWEIACIVKVLNRLGYWVDIIDRKIDHSFMPENKYDLFLGIGADDSGRHYAKYAQHLTKAIKIFYAASSNPDIRNKNLAKRYHNFSQRQNTTIPVTRNIKHIDMQENMKYTDTIFCVGNQKNIETYTEFKKNIHKINLSTSPAITIDQSAIDNKKSSKFLFFSGDGNILKGLDLVIEAFAITPKASIHICTSFEPAFLSHYRKLIDNSPNIHLEGFVKVNSKRFNELTSKCAFIILPSCSEGTATSVTTCMRRGCIPIVTPEAGIDTHDFGIELNNIDIKDLSQKIISLSSMSASETRDRAIKTYLASFQYTKQCFEQSIMNALTKTIAQPSKPTKLSPALASHNTQLNQSLPQKFPAKG